MLPAPRLPLLAPLLPLLWPPPLSPSPLDPPEGAPPPPQKKQNGISPLTIKELPIALSISGAVAVVDTQEAADQTRSDQITSDQIKETHITVREVL